MILALDPASKCGWSLGHSSGTEDFSLKKGEDIGHRIEKFTEWLTWNLHGVDMVFYEKPCQGHFQATRVHSHLEAIIILSCIEKGIGWLGVSASEVKKHATGKGDANKKMMLESARAKWPEIDIKDDNQADAMWIHDYAIKKLIET